MADENGFEGFGAPLSSQPPVVAPELAPIDSSYVQPGRLLNWLRRPSGVLVRPNNVTAYGQMTHIARTATVTTADPNDNIITLPTIGNIGQRLNLRLVVTEGRTYTDPPLYLRLFVYTKRPRGFPHIAPPNNFAGDGTTLQLAGSDIISGALHVPMNNLDSGGGYLSVGGILGGGLTSAGIEDAWGLMATARAMVIPVDGVVLQEENIYIHMVVEQPYTPIASCRYAITPFVGVA